MKKGRRWQPHKVAAEHGFKKDEVFVTVWTPEGRYASKVVNAAQYQTLLVADPPLLKHLREQWLRERDERSGVG